MSPLPSTPGPSPSTIAAASAGGVAGLFLIVILVTLWVYQQSIKRQQILKLEKDAREKPELDGDAVLPTIPQEMSTDRDRVEMGGNAIHEMGNYGLAFELDATERKEELPRYSNGTQGRPMSSNSLAVSPSVAGVV